MQVGCDQLSVDVTDLEWEICRTWGISLWSSVVMLSSQVILPWNVFKVSLFAWKLSWYLKPFGRSFLLESLSFVDYIG